MLAISIAVFFVGCQLPVAPAPAPGPGSGPKTGDLLASIPVVSAKLPRSLQDGTAPQASGSSRALGDVTTLNPDDISGVRADGYIQLKQELKNNFVSVVLSLLKAAVAGKDIPLDVDYTIGVKELPPELLPGPGGATTMDLGVIHLTRPSSDVLEAKWHMEVESTMTAGGVSSTINQDMLFFLRIVGNDTSTVKTFLGADMTQTGSGPEPMHFEIASKYDAVTNELVQVLRMGAYGQLTVLKNQGGFVRYYSLSPGRNYAAYANDDMGGVVSKNSSGSNASISTEYYDGQGDLVLQQWGDSSEPELGWLPNAAFNLESLIGGSAPNTITIKRVGEWRYHNGSVSDTSTYFYKVGGGSYTEFTNTSDGWYYVWKAGEDWAPGDHVYYQGNSDWSDYSSSYDEETDEAVYSSTSTVTYQIGYTVPVPETYLGSSYYMSNSFPLKALRLNDELAANYSLKMKEGMSYYNWTDGEGASHYESGEAGVPEGWTAADPDARWSWTNYSFWMENKATAADEDRYTDTAGFPTANPGKGDLFLNNIQNKDYWAWDPEQRRSVETKAVTVNTSLPEPVGFAFEHQPLVTAVKNELEDLYESIGDTAIDAAALKTKADEIITMPDLETFPSLPSS